MIGDQRFDREFLVHRSVLRSHGQLAVPVTPKRPTSARRSWMHSDPIRGASEEAVARVNQQGAHIWIVGLDLVYHRRSDDWAAHIPRVSFEPTAYCQDHVMTGVVASPSQMVDH